MIMTTITMRTSRRTRPKLMSMTNLSDQIAKHICISGYYAYIHKLLLSRSLSLFYFYFVVVVIVVVVAHSRSFL